SFASVTPVTATNSPRRQSLKPDDPYVTISEAAAWEALERWAQIHPRFALYAFRAACSLAPMPCEKTVTKWLRENGGGTASILTADLRNARSVVLDLSVGSTFLGADPDAAAAELLKQRVFDEMKRVGAEVGIGRYDEARLLYSSPLFGDSSNPTSEWRTIHLGIDLFAEPGTPLHAPLEGVVHTLANNAAPLD